MTHGNHNLRKALSCPHEGAGTWSCWWPRLETCWGGLDPQVPCVQLPGVEKEGEPHLPCHSHTTPSPQFAKPRFPHLWGDGEWASYSFHCRRGREWWRGRRPTHPAPPQALPLKLLHAPSLNQRTARPEPPKLSPNARVPSARRPASCTPSQPRDPGPLLSLTPSPAVETLTQASETSSGVRTGQGWSRGGHGGGQGACQLPPVPQFPGAS